MSGKIFLHFLIFCLIWSREIIGTFADEGIKESSDFLIRQKRVVSDLPGEDTPVNINRAPYVVYIKRDQRISCVGSILSPYTVITSAACVSLDSEHYEVASSTSLTRAGNIHYIIEIRKRMGHEYQHHIDAGIGLLIVNPPFVYTTFCKSIKLHTGPLEPGTVGKIHGWGFNFRSVNRGTNNPVKLRSIEVPIISHQTCVDRYRPHVQISDEYFCTFHPQRHSGHTDSGAGLVVNRELAGVFLWSGLNENIDPRYPDVFVSLENPYYNHWIRIHLDSIASHFENLGHH